MAPLVTISSLHTSALLPGWLAPDDRPPTTGTGRSSRQVVTAGRSVAIGVENGSASMITARSSSSSPTCLGAGAAARRARRFECGARRRRRDCGRLALRADAHGDLRDRECAGPLAPEPRRRQADRGRAPDRRAAEPGQLGRTAARCGRSRDRDQHGHPGRRSGFVLRRSVEHGVVRRFGDPRRRSRTARAPRQSPRRRPGHFGGSREVTAQSHANYYSWINVVGGIRRPESTRWSYQSHSDFRALAYQRDRSRSLRPRGHRAEQLQQLRRVERRGRRRRRHGCPPDVGPTRQARRRLRVAQEVIGNTKIDRALPGPTRLSSASRSPMRETPTRTTSR